MPMYEYSCPQCGAGFELLQRMGEGPEMVRCPSCHRLGVERQLSTFASRSAGGSGGATLSAGGCGGGGGFT